MPIIKSFVVPFGRCYNAWFTFCLSFVWPIAPKSKFLNILLNPAFRANPRFLNKLGGIRISKLLRILANEFSPFPLSDKMNLRSLAIAKLPANGRIGHAIGNHLFDFY